MLAKYSVEKQALINFNTLSKYTSGRGGQMTVYGGLRLQWSSMNCASLHMPLCNPFDSGLGHVISLGPWDRDIHDVSGSLISMCTLSLMLLGILLGTQSPGSPRSHVKEN